MNVSQVLTASAQSGTEIACTLPSSSADSVSRSSSTSSGSDASSLVAGAPIDSTDDPGAGLLVIQFPFTQESVVLSVSSFQPFHFPSK